MADPLLTPAELETLLAARAAGSGVSVRPSQAFTPRVLRTLDPGHDFGAASIGPGAPSDGKPLDEATLNQLREIHERAAAGLGLELSTLLRRAVRVKLLDCRQLPYRQGAARLAGPTCLNIVRAEPLADPWLAELHPAILFPMIDCLLGGGSEPIVIPRRPLTEIELRLAGRITALVLAQLQSAWHAAAPNEVVPPLVFDVKRVESDSHGVTDWAPTLPMVWLAFEVSLANARGSLNLALPCGCVVELLERLRDSTLAGISADTESRLNRGALVACLAELSLDADELARLEVGDIIATDQPAGETILLLVDGVPRYRARVGTHAGRKAVHIVEVLPPEETGETP